MSNKVTYVYQKLKNSLDRKGYLNINHIQIEGRKKLAEIGYLFKNPNYQTFRVLYMKDNYIVGEEIITTKLLHSKRALTISNTGIIRAEKCINKISNRMKTIQANKYLLIHTSPLERLEVSKQYLDTTTYFYTYLSGFMGHLIINSKSYLWIDIYKNNIYITNKNTKKDKKSIYKKLQKHSLSNICINSKKDIINLVSTLLIKDNHSIIAITKIGEMPKILIDIPNECINKKNKYIRKYFNSLKDLYKDSKIILVTDNGNTFKESLDLLLDNSIDDSIWYTELKGSLYMYDLPDLKKYKEYINKNSVRGNKYGRKKERRIFTNTI